MNKRPSAGTRSPASSNTTSPGTRSSAAISCFSPSSPHAGPDWQHLLQRSEAPLRAVLLVEADQRIDYDDGQDDDCVLDVADEGSE